MEAELTGDPSLQQDPLPVFTMGDEDEQAPEVLAQIVDDIDNGGPEVANTQGDLTAEEEASLRLGSFIPPQLPTAPGLTTETGPGGVHVRLTLSVGASGAQIAPGLEIDDCGMCPFCLDKPKYGGPGTKRQKCELKQQEASFAADNRDPRIWVSLHMISAQEMVQIKQISKLPLPEPLVKAIEHEPLPVVWAYRRKRRARTLPPAYVLMYYCENRVPLDRSQLSLSRQRYFKNSRNDTMALDKPRKPRVARRPPAPPLPMYMDPGHDPNMHAHMMAPPPMPDPNMLTWQSVPPPGGPCTVVYGQPVAGQQPPGYGAAPSYLPGPPGMIPPYGGATYCAPHMSYSQPPLVYSQPPMPQESQHHLAGRHEDDMSGVGGGYYAPQDPYDAPPPHPSMMQLPPQPPPTMEDEADGWLSMTDNPSGSPGGDYGSPGRGSKRAKRTGGPHPLAQPPPVNEAPPDEDNGDGNGMSNKTLELMLSRLQGQLPAATYEKVITLVRDVQMRRMSLSRSEFLQHFQAICAGQPKPR